MSDDEYLKHDFEYMLDGWRTMQAEILRLRAENEKLQWELGKALDTLVVHDAVCAENEKLRAALKPFADVLQDCTEDDYDDCDYVQVQYLYCREARAAMEGEDD